VQVRALLNRAANSELAVADRRCARRPGSDLFRYRRLVALLAE